MKINQLCKAAHEAAVSKGFYDTDKNISELLMLCVSELAEALEATRIKRKPMPEGFLVEQEFELDFKIAYEKYYKSCFESEIADAFIRLADLCGYLDIDIERHILLKMKYNTLRPYKHGKKF